jgi:hypothetical protein
LKGNRPLKTETPPDIFNVGGNVRVEFIFSGACGFPRALRDNTYTYAAAAMVRAVVMR